MAMALLLLVALLCMSYACAVPARLCFHAQKTQVVSHKPQSYCKIKDSPVTDVDMYYNSIRKLISDNEHLYGAGVLITDIIPNAGSGTYFLGCPHYKLEDGALLVNDFDGICLGDRCENAFMSAEDAAPDFFKWNQARGEGGLIFEMELFNAEMEANKKKNPFGKGEKLNWKAKIIDMYRGDNKVQTTELKTSPLRYCVPKTIDREDKNMIMKTFGCQFCNVITPKGVEGAEGAEGAQGAAVQCSTEDRIKGFRLKGFNNIPKDFCEGQCIPAPQGAPISVPDCRSMCFFKSVMLKGTPLQRGSDQAAGEKKHKQDALDFECLTQKCKLDVKCEESDVPLTEDNFKTEFKNWPGNQKKKPKKKTTSFASKRPTSKRPTEG